MTAHEFRAFAEEYIDKAGLANALGELAVVAGLKAEHIRTNYPESSILAETWEQASFEIEQAELAVHVQAVSD